MTIGFQFNSQKCLTSFGVFFLKNPPQGNNGYSSLYPTGADIWYDHVPCNVAIEFFNKLAEEYRQDPAIRNLTISSRTAGLFWAERKYFTESNAAATPTIASAIVNLHTQCREQMNGEDCIVRIKN